MDKEYFQGRIHQASDLVIYTGGVLIIQYHGRNFLIPKWPLINGASNSNSKLKCKYITQCTGVAMCTYRIAGIAREIATTKCMDPLCSRRNTTFGLTRGTLGAQRKNEGRVGRPWKEKNREKVKEGMGMRGWPTTEK